MSENEDSKPKNDPLLIRDVYSPEEIYRYVFRALMETDTDSIYVKDPMFRLNYVNRNMLTSLYLDDEGQLIGKTDKQIFGEEFGQKTQMNL